MSKLPTPETATQTRLGAHPLSSEYLTEKVKVVAVVPTAGLADPELRDGVWDGGHAGLAPDTGEAGSTKATIAKQSARRRMIAKSLLGDGTNEAGLKRTRGGAGGTCTRSTPGYRST